MPIAFGRGYCEPVQAPEIRHESRATNPFFLSSRSLRHSRESGNPKGGAPSPPSKTKRESQSTNPFPRLSPPRHSRESGNPEGGKPSPPSKTKSRSTDPFPHSPHPVIPAKAGIQKAASHARHPKPSPNRGQRIPSPHSPHPVIPAKAGIQRPAKPVAQNQAQIAVNGSLPPLRGKARMGVRRAQARLWRIRI